jgi:hypothetical protein
MDDMRRFNRHKIMNERRFSFASTKETESRRDGIALLFDRVFSPELRPVFVSDEASLLDISDEDERVLAQRIESSYGLRIDRQLLRLPVWKLVDYLSTSTQ